MKDIRKILIPLLVVILVAGAGVIAFSVFKPHTFTGTVIQSESPSPDLELLAHTGERVRLSDYRGQVVVLFFGYTFCPDVCPTTAGQLARAVDELGKKTDEVQVFFISIDPERDTPERLATYVTHFDERFIGLTGSEDEVAEAAALYGIFFEKQEGTADTGYLVDHTAYVIVLDREGYLKLLFPYGTSGVDMARDIAYIAR